MEKELYYLQSTSSYATELVYARTCTSTLVVYMYVTKRTSIENAGLQYVDNDLR